MRKHRMDSVQVYDVGERIWIVLPDGRLVSDVIVSVERDRTPNGKKIYYHTKNWYSWFASDVFESEDEAIHATKSELGVDLLDLMDEMESIHRKLAVLEKGVSHEVEC